MLLHPELRQSAWLMRHELLNGRLSVALMPCERGRRRSRIRVVEQCNPDWYRRLCAEYLSERSRPRRRSKLDTAIKRQGVLRALNEMENGRCETVYAKRLLPFVYEHYERFYLLNQLFVKEQSHGNKTNREISECVGVGVEQEAVQG